MRIALRPCSSTSRIMGRAVFLRRLAGSDMTAPMSPSSTRSARALTKRMLPGLRQTDPKCLTCHQPLIADGNAGECHPSVSSTQAGTRNGNLWVRSYAESTPNHAAVSLIESATDSISRCSSKAAKSASNHGARRSPSGVALGFRIIDALAPLSPRATARYQSTPCFPTSSQISIRRARGPSPPPRRDSMTQYQSQDTPAPQSECRSNRRMLRGAANDGAGDLRGLPIRLDHLAHRAGNGVLDN